VNDAGILVDLAEPAPEMGADGTLIEPQADGSVVVDFGGGAVEPEPPADAENLAELLSPSELDLIGQKVVEMVDADLESRKEWLERYQDGLKKCGAVDGGRTKVFADQVTAVHPLIVTAATQFHARALAELFPPTGPVKGHVVGPNTPELLAQAERVQSYMNYQLQTEDVEYFNDVDQMLFVLPFAGSCFKKTFIDEEGVVTGRFVLPEDVILPYRFRGHIRRCPRVTHRFPLAHQDFLDRQEAGRYLPMDKLAVQAPMGDQAGDAIAPKADGVTPTSLEEDREHEMLEMHTHLLPGMTPEQLKAKRLKVHRGFVVTVECESQKVVSIRRRDRDDGRARCWWTHYKYLPGFGAYGMGLIHAIGGLGEAATTALQELLHSAMFAARQGGFTSKEARLPQKQIQLEPGVWKHTEMMAEEISKAFYTPPFKEPPSALFNVLGLLAEEGKIFSSTTEAMVGGSSDNTPVGTTIARIEQGSKVYSAIHLRLHRAAGEEFALRAELHREVLAATGGPMPFVADGSEFQITAEDFDERVDVIPVSDPNIVSTPQRIALAEAVVARADQKPHLYDAREAERRYLLAMKVPDVDRLLMQPDGLKPVDAVTEGALALMGQGFRSFAEQDHAAHMAVHQGQLEMLAGSPLAAQVGPVLQAHIAEHMAHAWRLRLSMETGIQIPEPGMAKEMGVPPEIDAQVSQAAALAVQQQVAAFREAQAAAAAEAANTPDAEIARRGAEADVAGKELANEKAKAELEAQSQAPAIVEQIKQEVVEPLMQRMNALAAENEELKASLDRAAEEFGRALAEQDTSDQ
jgi:hypothetical protein